MAPTSTGTASETPSGLTPDRLPDSLVRSLRGRVHAPGSADYDRIRSLHNGMIDKRPGVIVECLGPGDVRETLRWASDEGHPVAVRAGGHNVAGNALNDGGLVLDVSSMQGVRVDPDRRVVTVQPGAGWGVFDRETQAFGLATTGGNISSTGVAGLTLGGGIGWLMRRYGLACDSLVGADVITPDGSFVRADAQSEPELLWGLKGGGGNFGVVTSFDFALHPFDHACVIGIATYPFEAATDLAVLLSEQAAEAPDDLILAMNFITSPKYGAAVTLFAGWFGPDVEEGDRQLRRLFGHGEPHTVWQVTWPYRRFHCMFDDAFRAGRRNYWKSGFFDRLDPDLVEAVSRRFREVPSPHTVIAIEQMGGQIARIPEESAAFPHRQAAYSLLATSMWDTPAEDAGNLAWSRDLWSAVEKHTRGVYTNFLGVDADESLVRYGYGDSYDRLRELKRRYDPQNILRYNQNIAP